MKRPPERVTIDGQTVRIRIVPQKKLGRMPQGYAWGGDYNPDTKTVTIGDGLTSRAIRAAVLHELMHHLWRRAGIDIPLKDEEYVLNQIDSWIVQMLDENPRLVDYLAGR